MRIGVPKEIKNHEYRVGLNPAGVAEYTRRGHEVFVERGAGEGSAIDDASYEQAGATMVEGAPQIWQRAEMIIKVKEPLEEEYERMRRGQIIYTFFHLAAVPRLAQELLKREVTALAYETIQLEDGRLPLLEPMSEVAGRMSIQVGARCLERREGGKGVLLGGVPGVCRGKVVIIGGGTVGTNAAKIAVGMGAQVTMIDVDLYRLRYLDDVFGNAVQTLHSNAEIIQEAVVEADLVIGAVLIPGAKAPQLVTRDHIREMSEGSVVVDVSVDQGGCIATCFPTTHDEPTYVVDGVVHYCVANMPGAVARTSTVALNNATLKYGLKIAGEGVESALRGDRNLRGGMNTFRGHCTHEAVAQSLGLDYRPLGSLLASNPA